MAASCRSYAAHDDALAGHRRVLGLLRDAGLDEPAAARDREALHAGRVLVLVDVAERDEPCLGAVLDG